MHFAAELLDWTLAFCIIIFIFHYGLHLRYSENFYVTRAPRVNMFYDKLSRRKQSKYIEFIAIFFSLYTNMGIVIK